MALSPCFISPESSSQDTSKILHNQHLITFLVQNRSRLIGLILPGVQLVRLRVNKEKRSSGWEMFWFPRILSIANPTGESRNLSALTSFWAWFMICTINVSMLIISWKMDLSGWEIERKRKILRQDKVNTADSAFVFLIILLISQNQWSGWSGWRRWSCLVWSLQER